MTDRLKIGSWFAVTAVVVVFAFAMGRSVGFNDALSGERMRAIDAKMAENAQLYLRQAEEIEHLQAATRPVQSDASR